jgi:DNA-binding MarR family transcriptional regulator
MLLDDPVVIRALAHPIRIELHALLGRKGPLTAADAARRLGISQALASHHLRQLAKYGFVEPAPGKDNRERPWRITSTSQSWRDAYKTAEGAAAADVLEQLLAEGAVSRLIAWQQRRRTERGAWRDRTGIGNTTVYLTAREFNELEGQIEALLQRYVEERPIDQPSTRPKGSRPVTFTHIVTALPDEGDER